MDKNRDSSELTTPGVDILDTAQTQQKREFLLSSERLSSLLPLFVLLTALAAFLLTAAVLPLYGLGFSSILPPSGLRQWLLLPTFLLFPQWRLAASTLGQPNISPAIPINWYETGLLLLAFSAVFAVYLVALR